MIINIPLQIDEQQMNEVLQKDYEGKVVNEIVKYIRKTLASSSRSHYGNQETEGMKALIQIQIDTFLENHRDEIIKCASVQMAEKLARSKRGKEILEEIARAE